MDARARPRGPRATVSSKCLPAFSRRSPRIDCASGPYSLSALQRFASCPYQFLLATIYRLEPWDEPEPLVRMDPLTRGSLFHRVQAEFYRAMDADGALPITRAGVRDAATMLDGVIDRVAAEYAERLAPAIERVWRDEIDEIRRDLGIWLQKLAEPSAWRPMYFEFSFGLNDEGRDPRSLPDPILVDGRFVLRGSVDLVEHRADLDVFRITDHKTGKNRSTPDLVVGGGAVLQPVLYSVAVEQGLGKKAVAGRLFYCTTAGGFIEHEIPVNDYTRGQGLQALDDHRSRGRTGLPRGRAGRARVHVVRLPSGVRTARGRADEAEASGQAGRPRRAEEHAMTHVADDVDARQAISDALDETLVVEAAAGTGKTTELVKRDPSRARNRPRDDACRSWR